MCQVTRTLGRYSTVVKMVFTYEVGNVISYPEVILPAQASVSSINTEETSAAFTLVLRPDRRRTSLGAASDGPGRRATDLPRSMIDSQTSALNPQHSPSQVQAALASTLD